MKDTTIYPKFYDMQKVYFKWGEYYYEGTVIGFTVLHNKINFYTVVMGDARKNIAEKELFSTPEDLARAVGEDYINITMADKSIKGVHIDKSALRKFDIWEEGFQVMEASGTAHLVASGVEGVDFLDACKRRFKNDSLFDIRNGVPCRWGCRLYDNEAEARRSFG